MVQECDNSRRQVLERDRRSRGAHRRRSKSNSRITRRRLEM